ncbi:MAG: hypothetical protein WKF30_06120 [Pyrinomonadaceae bacterium]
MRSSYFFLPFVLIVVGMVLYHVCQKSIPQSANPFYTYVIIYAVALAVSGIGAIVYAGEKSLWQTLRDSNWAVVIAAGFAVVAIEIGFLLAYRIGWNISTAGVACSVTVTALLMPIGLIFYHEQLTPRNILGLVFCLLGLVLVVKQ